MIQTSQKSNRSSNSLELTLADEVSVEGRWRACAKSGEELELFREGPGWKYFSLQDIGFEPLNAWHLHVVPLDDGTTVATAERRVSLIHRKGAGVRACVRVCVCRKGRGVAQRKHVSGTRRMRALGETG